MSRPINYHFVDITEKLAKKYNLKYKEAEFILRTQFEFIQTEIQKDEYIHIKLKHLGKWMVNWVRKYKRDDYYKRKANNTGMEQSIITEDRNTPDQIRKTK